MSANDCNVCNVQKTHPADPLDTVLDALRLCPESSRLYVLAREDPVQVLMIERPDVFMSLITIFIVVMESLLVLIVL